ncbi:MAG: NAD(P)/FAD-dependent oxidoreductase [Bacteroidales bacterium]|nr:NAD(P)/FAD-dependent oxidoreductase [Bacteroidales bacterium]
MTQTISFQISPKVAANEFLLKKSIAENLSVPLSEVHDYRITKRSIDARSRNIKMNLTVLVAFGNDAHLPKEQLHFEKRDVSLQPEVHIVGAGPAGLFAALRLIELNLRPIILEQGKDVSERKKDIARLNQNEGCNPLSNYCFGEGGAGTFSDGKLYTRSKKKGDNRRILELFVIHGAHPSILVDAHPHLGTDKLPDIISNMRNTILECGGEIHFNTQVIDFEFNGNKLSKLICQNQTFSVQNVILAMGHSARPLYYAMHNAGVELEAKACAMGVRVEHPQEMINHIQYHGNMMKELPAASYSLVHQVDGRGVYSFCMCPGGIIVPSMTAENQTVVNGMSNSRRNSPFANSGMIVELQVSDYADFQQYGVLSGLKFQEQFEALAFQNGGQRQIAPAQRISDFIRNKISPSLSATSYLPGLVSSPMHFWMPPAISKRLQEGLKFFDRQMHGFASSEGKIVGVESRSSSPVRIPRNPETLSHIRIENLFPCGEGAGYAGGIVSSAIDGMNCAESISHICHNRNM